MVQLKTLEFLHATKNKLFFFINSQFKLDSFHHFYKYTVNMGTKTMPLEREMDELLLSFPLRF